MWGPCIEANHVPKWKKYTEGPTTCHRDTKSSSNRKTRYVGSFNYTKLVTISPSVVLTPVLSYVAAESAWNPCGGPTCQYDTPSSLFPSFIGETILIPRGDVPSFAQKPSKRLWKILEKFDNIHTTYIYNFTKSYPNSTHTSRYKKDKFSVWIVAYCLYINLSFLFLDV